MHKSNLVTRPAYFQLRSPNKIGRAGQVNAVPLVERRRDADGNTILRQARIESRDPGIVARSRVSVRHRQDRVQQDAGAFGFECRFDRFEVNVWQLTGDPAAGTNQWVSGISGTVYPAIGWVASYSGGGRINTKSSELTYSPPSGFSQWAAA